ncbi:MAG: alpha/beta fold hydrolase [Candidatus Chisholmbacteria bacterium]|nr:alpha/beta fold hydrolase [Candidatus Chisholmbacteria bacterium]
MPPTKIVFLHGNDTMRWSYAWAPWLKRELDRVEVENIFETFPDSILARKKYWLAFLKEKVQADERTILVGHSSGATAAMRYAETEKVLGSVLIAPSYTDTEDALEKQSGYFDTPWRWERIRKNQQFIGLFYSKDDPYIPQREFEHIKSKLRPETFVFQNRKHFMDETFPELLEYLKEKTGER